MAAVPYAAACGSLMFGMTATRPDIAYAMQVVSRFMANPSKTHSEAIKLTIRYLKGTKSRYLCYGKGPLELKGLCYANMDSDVDTCKSTSIFTM